MTWLELFKREYMRLAEEINLLPPDKAVKARLMMLQLLVRLLNRGDSSELDSEVEELLRDLNRGLVSKSSPSPESTSDEVSIDGSIDI